MNRQKSFNQKGTMYRGMAFASNEDAEKFVNGIKGGGKLNRTLTSFTTDKYIADQFSGGGTAQVTMNLVKSKNLKRFSGLDRGSMGEKEYVLTFRQKPKHKNKPMLIYWHQYHKANIVTGKQIGRAHV